MNYKNKLRASYSDDLTCFLYFLELCKTVSRRHYFSLAQMYTSGLLLHTYIIYPLCLCYQFLDQTSITSNKEFVYKGPHVNVN